jgi:hypothetical protein
VTINLAKSAAHGPLDDLIRGNQEGYAPVHVLRLKSEKVCQHDHAAAQIGP